MAVKLRLMRMGKKKQPTYRVVAADSRSPRNGRFIEIVGTYQPRQDPSVINIDNDRAVAWLQQGAKPTERVEKLLKISGAWEQFTGVAPDLPPVPEPTPQKGYTPPSPAKPKAAPAEASADSGAGDDADTGDDGDTADDGEAVAEAPAETQDVEGGDAADEAGDAGGDSEDDA